MQGYVGALALATPAQTQRCLKRCVRLDVQLSHALGGPEARRAGGHVLGQLRQACALQGLARGFDWIELAKLLKTRGCFRVATSENGVVVGHSQGLFVTEGNTALMRDEDAWRSHVSPACSACTQAPVGFFAVTAQQVDVIEVTNGVDGAALDVQAEATAGFDFHWGAVGEFRQFVQLRLLCCAGHRLTDTADWKAHQFAVIGERSDRGDIFSAISNGAQAIKPVAMHPGVGVEPDHILLWAQGHAAIHAADETQIDRVLHQRDPVFAGQYLEGFAERGNRRCILNHYHAMRRTVELAGI